MDRFIRTKALIGAEGFQKLKNAHVAVIGLGGVGGHALEGLVRAGIGKITAIDGDQVSLSNCNRQLLALSSTIGRSKVQAAEERMKEINPALEFFGMERFISQENIDALPKDLDFLVDCIDDAPAKVALASFCREHRIPMVMCMGTGNRLTSEGLKFANFKNTEGCPLAKKMRLLLKEPFQKVRCLYSAAPISPAFPIEDGGKRTVGSISFVPAVAGLKLSEYVVTALLEEKEKEDIPQ